MLAQAEVRAEHLETAGALLTIARGLAGDDKLAASDRAALVIAPPLTALADVLAEPGQTLQARALYDEAIETAQRIGLPHFEMAATVGRDKLVDLASSRTSMRSTSRRSRGI